MTLSTPAIALGHPSCADYHSALIRNIRQSDDTGAGALTQSWDFSLEDHEAEFRDDLRLATGIGKRGRKKGRRVRTFAVNTLLRS